MCFGSFASLLTYLGMSAIRPISDLQFDVANTKQCRGVATRYDTLAANYLAFIKLAAIPIWLRAYKSTT